jgi:hypothetical protein
MNFRVRHPHLQHFNRGTFICLQAMAWGSDSLQIQLVNGNTRKAAFFRLSPYMLG